MTTTDVDTCKHGHPWSPENTYNSPQGTRQCKRCRADNQARYQSEGRRGWPGPRWVPAAPLLALQAGRTDQQFADDLGVNRRTVSRWRHTDGATITRVAAGRYATALGRDTSSLWPELTRG